MTRSAQVKPHPQGGWTVAVPLPGTSTAMVYVGHYKRRDEARNARRELLPVQNRAMKIAQAIEEAPV